MSSERQIAANRRNGRKGRGPRTAAGKAIASRNALNHGLAAIAHRPPDSKEDLERFAKALCGDDHDPALFEQALIIAKNDLVLRAITAQQLAVVERLWDPTARALAKGDNSLALGAARLAKSKLALPALEALRDQLLEKHKDELGPATLCDLGPLPSNLMTFLYDKEGAAEWEEQVEAAVKSIDVDRDVGRDESARLEEASRDLIRLDRYERRARSRQRRTIFAFMNLRVMRRIEPTSPPSRDQQPPL